jgi:predicted Zn finger-like uncharacterized protein
LEKTSVILSCPSCSAQYFADDKAIGEAGRTVRCAACGHSWCAKPELSLEQQFDAADLSRDKVERVRQADTAGAVSPHQAFREREIAKRRKGSLLAAVGAWTGSAVVFFGLGATAVINRDDVVKYWPQAATAYAMAGFETNRFGLEFGPVDAERTFDGTTPVLNLAGSIQNISDDFRPVPVVRIDLRDDQGRSVDSVLITLNEDVLAPGKESRFSTRIDNPPLEAFDLAMSFAEPDRQDIRLAVSQKSKTPVKPVPDDDDDEPLLDEPGDDPDKKSAETVDSDPKSPH